MKNCIVVMLLTCFIEHVKNRESGCIECIECFTVRISSLARFPFIAIRLASEPLAIIYWNMLSCVFYECCVAFASSHKCDIAMFCNLVCLMNPEHQCSYFNWSTGIFLVTQPNFITLCCATASV